MENHNDLKANKRQNEKDSGHLYRILFLLVMAIFIYMIVPILYCALFNRATGDDFGKSAAAHLVLMHGGNWLQALGAAIQSAVNQYLTWEGTWFSNLIISYQPGIFGEQVYGITTFLALGSLLLGNVYFFYEVLRYQFGILRWSRLLIYTLVMLLMIQYMPYIRGGMFWYTGMAHYDYPYCVALVCAAWMMKYLRTDKKRYFVYLLLGSFYVGGSHYQAMLMYFLLYLGIILIGRGQDRTFGNAEQRKTFWNKICLMLIPAVITAVGMIICIFSPGNGQRGGEAFQFSIYMIVKDIVISIGQSTMDAVTYIYKGLPIAVVAIFFVLIGFETYREERSKLNFRIGILFLVYLYLFYCAMYTPGLYDMTDVGLSGGYYDTNYYVMLLCICTGALFIGSWIRSKTNHKSIRNQADISAAARHLLVGYCIIAVVAIGLLYHRLIRNSWYYQCREYISSGQLDDFRDQMNERIAILNNPEIKNVVLPQMNNEQGPFMHMPLSNTDKDAFTNMVTQEYYDKESVLGMDRVEFYENYNSDGTRK